MKLKKYSVTSSPRCSTHPPHPPGSPSRGNHAPRNDRARRVVGYTTRASRPPPVGSSGFAWVRVYGKNLEIRERPSRSPPGRAVRGVSGPVASTARTRRTALSVPSSFPARPRRFEVGAHPGDDARRGQTRPARHRVALGRPRGSGQGSPSRCSRRRISRPPSSRRCRRTGSCGVL